MNKAVPEGTTLLCDYMAAVEPTDELPHENLKPILMGLFGEVGSIMANAKKHLREKSAYVGYQRTVEEEFGDALWYFTALCRRLGIGADMIFAEVINQSGDSKLIDADDLLDSPVSHNSSIQNWDVSDQMLLDLGTATAALLSVQSLDERTRRLLRSFVDRYLQTIKAIHVSFPKVVRVNVEKTRGRFLAPDISALPTFDDEFPHDERLPQRFKITINQRKSGQTYLQWNGVFLGDPLMDSILDSDGYRFHDVFHFAYAAILHWSPTFRALIKQKRKSDPEIDETQDGGRAIVVEEGLTAWIFSCAKELDFFEQHDGVSFDLLKTVQQFVQGYEVEICPLKLWERAILDGYTVFRHLRNNNGGVVVGNRDARTIKYKMIGSDER